MNITDAADIIGVKPATFEDRMNRQRAEDIAAIAMEMANMSQASVLHALTLAWQDGALFAYRDMRGDER